MLGTFLDNTGVEQHECVPVERIVNSSPYIKVLKHLRDATWLKRPEKWRNNWILHHNNVP
jgi:hypothetical protein